MANNDVIIRISAQDAASPVFKRITNEAKAMGAQVDQVGTKSGGAFDKLSKGGAALGATFGVLSGALSDAARAAAEAEAATARLDTAFENAGLSTADYAAQITQLQDMSISLAFDDEDATDALARLVTTTGDVNRAMEDVGIAMDIARARQISLAEATKIVEAVEQGRTGALTRMGIAVDETMSKEEQLAAIQGKYAGQAEAYANTAAGAIDRYRVKWEEVQESVGGAMGPLTSIIGLLPGLSTGFTAASSAVTAFAGSARAMQAVGSITTFFSGPLGLISLAAAAGVALYELSKAFDKDYTESVRNADVATKSFTAALADLATQAVVTSTDLALINTGNKMADAVTEQIGLFAALNQAASEYQMNTNKNPQLHATDEIFSGISQETIDKLDTMNGGIKDGVISLEDLIKYMTEAGMVTGDASNIIARFGAGVEGADQATQAWTDATKAMNAVLADNSAGGQKAQEVLLSWMTQVENGTMTIEEFEAAVAVLPSTVDAYNVSIVNATDASKEHGRLLRLNGENAEWLAKTMHSTWGVMAESPIPELISDGERMVMNWKRQDAASAGASMQLAENNRIADEATGRQARLDAGLKKTNAAFSAQEAAQNAAGRAAADYSAILGDLITQITDGGTPAEDFSTSLANLNEIAASGEQPMSDLMIATEAKSQADKAAADAAAAHAAELQRLEDAARGAYEEVDNVYEAMSTGYRVIVSNTDSIASNANQLNDWALGLIGVRGQYGKIDDLLKAGTISQEEYNAAQLAQESIAQSSLRTQEAVYTIQAKQAPLLAELADQQADYIEGLATLPADQQLAALGFMDAAQSARALALAQFAVSDATMEAKENLILAAAEADPVLREMLLQMDVITEDKNGNISINTDQAQSGMDLLNETLIELNNTIAIISGHPELVIRINAEDYATDVLTKYVNNPWYSTGSGFGAATGHVNGGGPTAVVAVTANTTDADTGLGNVDTRLMELNDASADPDITADDKASSKITTVSTDLATLDGQRATTYIDTYVTTYTQTRGMATGGTVRYAAMGTTTGYSGAMQPTIVGEVGPELLMLPTGSQVMSAPATRSRAGGGMGGDIIVNVQGDVYGIDDLALKVSRELAPAIRDAFGQHYAGQGAWS